MRAASADPRRWSGQAVVRIALFEESMEGLVPSELVVMASGLGAGRTEAAAKGSGT